MNESFHIGSDEVHVWRLHLALYGSAEAGLLEWLDEGERHRAGRIRHQQTRHQFICVRATLRWLLGRYRQCPPEAIGFALGEHGKPRLAESEPDRGLVFNVSHSGQQALFAFSNDTALGVDVEFWRPLKNLEALAERCLAASEWGYWRALPAENRLAAWFAFWTCKEAFAKAAGAGIGLGLQQCVVDREGEPCLIALPPGWGRPNDWRLVEIDVGASASAALCYRGAARKLQLTELTVAPAVP